MADGPDPLRFDEEAARRIEEMDATDDVVAERRDVVVALAPAAVCRYLFTATR